MLAMGSIRRIAIVALAGFGTWQVAAAADAPFGVDVVSDLMAPMRDGVRLAADIYRPTRDGTPLDEHRPVVLIRTPYGKGNGKSSDGNYFASHGYVAVIQDTRGRYRSEGVWHWIMLNAGKGSNAAQDEGTAAVLTEMSKQLHDYLKLLPLRRGTTPLKLAPEYESWLLEAMRHRANDAFWDQNNVVDHPERYSDIPIYLVGGWYDSWAGNTTANDAALSKRLKSDVYLIMGPWIHGAQGSDAHGQVTFGKDAVIAHPPDWRRTWFDHYLKDETNDVGHDAPFKSKVRIFVMGTGDGHKDEQGRLNHGGYWRDVQEWPPARAVPMKHFLAADGLRTTSAPETTESSAATSTPFTFDPRHPVPTIGGNISPGNDILLQGAWGQRGGSHVRNWQQPIPLSARNDVVVFQSEPLADDLDVTGAIASIRRTSYCQ